MYQDVIFVTALELLIENRESVSTLWGGKGVELTQEEQNDVGIIQLCKEEDMRT